MAFLQLHYTSCENGLSGYSGFQFCALTQGVSRAMMREVERQTIYEPPTIELATGQQTPVNLLYMYDEGLAAVIIARIEFTGLDFSNRLGNYFVHALVSTNPEDDLRSLLPVELWDAPFWQSSQGADTELPPLDSPPPLGPVTRQAVLASGVCTPEQLAIVATVADQALNAGRQLLLVGKDTGTMCRCIAAAAYLLGPGSARRLTFSTYSYDPLRGRTHVVCTVEDTRRLTTERTVGFHIVDLVTGKLPDVPPCPAAILLARLGVVAAAGIWCLAGSLGAAPELPLSEAIAVLASAALIRGEPLTPDEASIAIEWLSAAADEGITGEHLAAAVSASLSQPLAELPAPRKQQLIALAERADSRREQVGGTARAAGADSLTSRLEVAMVAGAMDAADEGRPLGVAIALHQPAALLAAAEHCGARLATADAAQALDLLAWASAAGANPASEVIRHVGRDAIVSGLVAMAELPGLADAARAWPDLRAGMADGIAALPEADQQRLIAGTVAGNFLPEDFAGHRELGEEWVITQARTGAISPVAALTHVMTFRRTWQPDPVVDETLIGRLWPKKQWTVAEAVQVTGLPPGEIGTEPVTSRLAALLDRVPRQIAEGGWTTLVDALDTLPPGTLPPPVAELAAELAQIIRLTRDEVRRGEPVTAVAILIRRYGTGSPVADDFIRAQLPPLLIGYRELGAALAGWPAGLFIRFCDYIREEGDRGGVSMSLLASLFVAMQRLEKTRHYQYADLLSDRALGPMLQEWTKPEITTLGIEADRIAKETSVYIDVWFLRNSRGRRFRLPHIRRRDP